MNNEFSIKIRLCHPEAKMPVKANPSDSGWDLTAVAVIAKTKNIFFMDTGLQIEPPTGCYTEVYPRSSIYKVDFIQTNSVGIIDNGYRGNIIIPLRYLGDREGLSAAKQLLGQRIAQLILKEQVPAKLEQVESLTLTQRGQAGFGSSGTH